MTLPILLVEDSEGDATLLSHHLTRLDKETVMVRVDTAVGLNAALAAEIWDIVISDYVMKNSLLGCDKMQGYLHSKPAPGDIFETRFLVPNAKFANQDSSTCGPSVCHEPPLTFLSG